MSDYSGPYDGRAHDPSELRARHEEAEKREAEGRPTGEDRAVGERRERSGDEGEGEETGGRERSPGAGAASVTGPPPTPEG